MSDYPFTRVGFRLVDNTFQYFEERVMPSPSSSALVLFPDIRTCDIKDFEAALTDIRARRTSIALEYIKGEQMKLTHSRDKVEQKLGRQYDLLGKDIEKLDGILSKIDDRLATIHGLRLDTGLLNSLIDDDEGDEDA